uniref:glycosyltransferase family 39 protein n=1 Tax=Halobacterium bonnevillei TaxID=2692200 RepID=UPI002D7E9433|nr:glycosyltransferase family 39 protein [Halobacterium bonnevillei]
MVSREGMTRAGGDVAVSRRLAAGVQRVRAASPVPLAPLVLALVAAAAAYALSVTVFPYHSSNHDEAVYLQQAAMLLEGQLVLRPPVEDAFRPWFFVDSSNGLYPKYAPVTAAVYALGELAGSFRYALPAVAAATTALLYGVVREAFDYRTGVVAAVALLCSPLFLLQSAVFLPYAPTTMLNLAFAFAYFRAERTGSVAWAAVAGAAVGLAFFSRPYTAVLFAAPFVAHAVWTLAGSVASLRDDWTVRPTLRRRVATASLGLAGVAVTLSYNAVVTGDPLVFPYEAFAPLDGLGFGTREILDYQRDYTPALALEANARVVWQFVSRWGPFGVVGAPLAVLGAFATARREWRWQQAVLAGVAGSVVVGNVYFWGNLNVLGALGDPGDGLIASLGPYYHFDLLVPARVRRGGRVRSRRRRSTRARRPVRPGSDARGGRRRAGGSQRRPRGRGSDSGRRPGRGQRRRDRAVRGRLRPTPARAAGRQRRVPPGALRGLAEPPVPVPQERPRVRRADALRARRSPAGRRRRVPGPRLLPLRLPRRVVTARRRPRRAGTPARPRHERRLADGRHQDGAARLD